MTPDGRARLVAGIGLLVLTTGLLHLAHVVGGHEWFSFYGPVITVAVTAVVLRLLGGADGRDTVGLFATLLGLLVVPEWFEGELSAGHALEWSTLEGHGAMTLVVLGVSAALLVLWEALRVLSLLRPE